MATRNLTRPSYVIAVLLGFLALLDAGNGFITMQQPDICKGLSQSQIANLSCGGNAAWIVDLGAAAIGAALLAAVLMRPYLYVFGAVVAWSALAFVSNLAMRHSGSGVDPVATVRLAVYLVICVVAIALLSVEVKAKMDADAAAAAAQPK
jgi:hypothetical protein